MWIAGKIGCVREMPSELVKTLRRVHALEAVAMRQGGLWAQRRASSATGALMLAVVEAGWQRVEIVRVVGIRRHAVDARVMTARERFGEHLPALSVPEPFVPLPEPNRLAILALPVDEREWMTSREASTFAGVSRSTVRNWTRDGLLPSTDRSRGTHLLLRADIVRIMHAARTDTRGVNHTALRTAILDRG